MRLLPDRLFIGLPSLFNRDFDGLFEFDLYILPRPGTRKDHFQKADHISYGIFWITQAPSYSDDFESFCLREKAFYS